MKLVTIEKFREIDLRVARVLSAEAVPGTDKLLRLEVDLGGDGERRQLVAGIAKQYKPEELLGRQIIVVANLQPAVIRGIESRGMLLAAVWEEAGREELSLVTLDREAPNGARVS